MFFISPLPRYRNGVHWRAPLAWVLGVFPTMPGLIMTTRDATAWNVWVRIFHIAFFVGRFAALKRYLKY
jgi:NCS1 family nucleobase:cation symporter-1